MLMQVVTRWIRSLMTLTVASKTHRHSLDSFKKRYIVMFKHLPGIKLLNDVMVWRGKKPNTETMVTTISFNKRTDETQGNTRGKARHCE